LSEEAPPVHRVTSSFPGTFRALKARRDCREPPVRRDRLVLKAHLVLRDQLEQKAPLARQVQLGQRDQQDCQDRRDRLALLGRREFPALSVPWGLLALKDQRDRLALLDRKVLPEPRVR